jgi:homogentisate phytyltransferase / homogentisate geranylgeranyltransferase
MSRLAVLLRFSRPHTIVATSTQVLTLFLISGGLRPGGPAALLLLLLTLISALAVNLYIVGLNQITDIEIDKLNKPELPIAAGDLTPHGAYRIVAVAGTLGLVLAWLGGPVLLATLGAILLIGTAYSLPLVRLKRFPIWAALSIAVARGLLANLGVALHFHLSLGNPIPLPALIMLGVFFFGFAIVIALYKDLPDIVGDRAFAIETFTTRFGPRRVLLLGQLILTFSYMLPIVLGLVGLPQPEALFLLLSHLAVVGLFWLISSRVDLASHAAIKRFYMFIWLLFYTEFVLLSIYGTVWSVA